jgi:hypothetical protein
MKKASPGIAALGFLLAFAAIVDAQTSEPPPTRDKPLWKESDRAIGYRSWSLWAEISWVGPHHLKILFPDQDHLALAWLLPDPTAQSPAGAIPLPDTPSILHMLLLDSKTGRSVVSHDWRLTSHTVDLVSTAHGHWVVKDGDQVSMYSAGFEKLHDNFVGDWRQVAPTAGEGNGALVGEDTRINSTPNELALVKTDGQVLFRHMLPEKQEFENPVTVAANGSVFAAVVTRRRGIDNPDLGFKSLQAENRVVVYSVRSRGPVFSVKVKGMSPWRRGDIYWNTIALSPQGDLLAIASNEEVRVYALPGTIGTK